MKVILLLFVLSSIGEAHSTSRQTPSMTTYYHYDGKALQLDRFRFHRYVLPQLRAMSREYSYLLQKLYPSLKRIFPLKEGLKKYRRELRKGKISCLSRSPTKRDAIKCEDIYRQVYIVGRKIDRLGLTMQQEMSFSLSKKNQKELDAAIKILGDLEEVSRLNYSFLHLVERGLIFYGSDQKNHERVIKKAIQQTRKLEFLWHMITVDHLTKEDQKLFDSIWSNFFFKIDRHVIHPNNKKYLLRHLEELNIAWNTFNMKLTKGVRKYPKAVENMVLKMHERWNAVLKVILYI